MQHAQMNTLLSCTDIKQIMFSISYTRLHGALSKQPVHRWTVSQNCVGLTVWGQHRFLKMDKIIPTWLPHKLKDIIFYNKWPPYILNYK